MLTEGCWGHAIPLFVDINCTTSYGKLLQQNLYQDYSENVIPQCSPVQCPGVVAPAGESVHAGDSLLLLSESIVLHLLRAQPQFQ